MTVLFTTSFYVTTLKLLKILEKIKGFKRKGEKYAKKEKNRKRTSKFKRRS